MKNIDHGDANDLTALVKDELAAVETYKQALAKVGDAPGGSELRRIEADHEDALSILQERLDDLEVATDAGLWGTWSQAVESVAQVFGNKAAIMALKEGEEHGVHDYEDALRNESLGADIRRIISSQILPKTRAHIPALERLLEKAGQ
jgi:hypothetical protein